jgi:hypothetical protein
VFYRDYFCLAIDLITKHYECSFYFLIISLFFMYISWGFVRARDEWHLLKLFGVTIFSNFFPGCGSGPGEEWKGLGSAFNRSGLYGTCGVRLVKT